ncbi:DNA recombination protein RmuC [Nocardioides jiangxiensis]|uniref:DNA recombination protein RmuC n=1 Tax=Nocardioides jiangxiensis TaxID=3064524 RepID=A0ABT9AXX7_9ACTN|nr:DNA recombination protein RmuC [Nocardioides sp. WY-20]MDO7866804.1 DNA recombination protein RmuC [Nocardioides sp. WY-20]
MLLIGLLLGLLVGAALGWLAARVRLDAAAAALPTPVVEDPEVAAAHHRAEIAAIRHEEAEVRATLQAEVAHAEATVAGLRDTVARLQQALVTARDDHQALLESQRRDQAERQRAEAGQTQVLKTLAPVAQQLLAMQRKVDELEQQRALQHGELAEQLRTTRRTAEESRKAADTLASALGNNATRGYWGETQLKTLVESAGLLPRVDFTTQASITADSGARRPDMVVNLPGGKQMAVDAKAPYTSFVEAFRSSADPAERHRLLVDHARKIRGHVDALSGKSYWTGLDASPEFTVAFIPNEQLLNAALEVDPSLMEYAFAKGVVLATPANLWAVLKTVAYTWRQDVLTEDAKRLFDLGQELYRRICTLAGHAEKMRSSLESAVNHYNSFASSLESRVLVTARKLDQVDEAKLLPSPTLIEKTPKRIVAADFEALRDVARDELPLHVDDAVDAEVVDDSSATG